MYNLDMNYQKVKKVIIFDLDGVIIDSSDIQKQALFESYRIVGGKRKISFEEFIMHSGDSLENIFQKMELPLEMLDHYRRISCEQISKINIFNGMDNLLAKIRAEFLCALCTGKERKRVLEILDKKEIKNYFNIIICSDDVNNPKPNPESINLILKELGCKKESSVMIGDAKNDILCAKSAGIKSIAVTWGCFEKSELIKQEPDVIAEDISELYKGILQLLGEQL